MYRVRTKCTYPWAATVMCPCTCFNEQGVADISSLCTCWTKEAWVVPSQYGHARLWRGPPFQINLAWKMPFSTLAWILSWCWFSRNHTLYFLLFFFCLFVCVHTAAFKLSGHTEGNNCHLVGFCSHMNVYKSVWLDKIPRVSWEEIGACRTSDLSLLIGVDQASEEESSPEEEEKCWGLARRQAGEARAKPQLCFLSNLGDKSVTLSCKVLPACLWPRWPSSCLTGQSLWRRRGALRLGPVFSLWWLPKLWGTSGVPDWPTGWAHLCVPRHRQGKGSWHLWSAGES